MNFWIMAIALLAIPAAIIGWPMFAGTTRERMTGILLLMMMPMVGVLLYQQVGNPVAINPPPVVAPPVSMEDMVANLQQRLIENPEDAEGWVILGRSLKSMRRYSEAESALVNANRLLPENPLVMVELAEARLFASGKPDIDAGMRQLVEAALKIDPLQQKALWLLGMAAVQDGDDEQAIGLWQKLLDQVNPESGIAQALTGQIDMAKSRLGQDNIDTTINVQPGIKEQPGIKKGPAFELPVRITIDDELTAPLPETAVLFVFMHPKGQKGMPLAVKRIANPEFPTSLIFSDADLLRPGNSLRSYPALDISARISMSGIANKSSGDLQADLINFKPKLVRKIALRITQRVP